VFVNGIQKTPADSATKTKRWADTRGIQATNALFLPPVTSQEEQSTEELGDFQSKEDKDYKAASEKEKPRIVWHTERRCFLNNISNAA
jgi:hypothetical protein